MIAFIAGHGMRRLPGYVTEEVPSVVCLKRRMRTAGRILSSMRRRPGAPFVTMSEVLLEKDDLHVLMEQIREQNFPDGDGPEIEDAEHLLRHVGKLGYLQLGFAHQGVMFLFETATEWYDQFQDLMETVHGPGRDRGR